MKRVIAAFWLILLAISTAFAIESPHISNMSCSGTLGCHTITLIDGVYVATLVDAYGVNNLCLKCHNPQTMARGYSARDIANPFGSTDTGLFPSEQLQTSHNWAGPVNMPPAGAQISTDPAILALRPTKAGVLGCTSCHNHHSFTGDLLLRRPGDTLCLDCHRQRNQRDVQSGTHPVNFNYTSATSKVKLTPAKFFKDPVNANPANPTSAMLLPGGKLVCTTCHSPHYADSNARTFDNASSSSFGLLSSSRGKLLRTDVRAGSANGVNICTNCHAGKRAHNGKGQNIQCADCHAAHVDPLDGTAPNVWLVRRYMNPLTTYTKVVNQYKDGASNWAGPDGVCVACHAIPAPGGNYPPEHASLDPNVCRSCHVHDSADGSFAAGCNSCHGNPPQLNAAGPSGYATSGSSNYATSGVFKDESLTPHLAHTSRGLTCAACHSGNQHASGDFQQVFRTRSGTAAYYGATPTYDPTGSGSCLTNYCHSNGAPSSVLPVYKTATWALGKNSIVGTPGECSACHDAAPGTNAHTAHLSRGYSCTVCHAATAASNSSIKDASKHVNGIKEMSFSGAALGTQIDTSDTCTTSYCHSNGRGVYSAPNWTMKATGACGTCHATAPGLGSPLIASGAHFAHFSTSAAAYGPMLTAQNSTGCQACHNVSSANHVNQSIDLNGTLGYLRNGTGTCTPCHAAQVNWSTGAVTCESCHTGTLSVINGATAPNKSLAATAGHGAPAIGKGCTACHERNARHINGGSRLQAQLKGSLNADCRYCHDNASVVVTGTFQNMSTHFLTKGGSQAMACAQCHDPHGSTNLHMIKTVINGKAIVFNDAMNGLVNTSTNQGLCQVCHTQTTHYRAGVPETSHPTANCLSCHDHRATGGAFKPTGTCDACHGYPPAPKATITPQLFGVQGSWSSARYEDYSGGGGAHLVAAHVSPNAKPSEGWSNCAICHNGGSMDSGNHKMTMPLKGNIENVDVAVDHRYRFSTGFIIYTGAKRVSAPAQNATGSCYNASCHITQSRRWSIER